MFDEAQVNCDAVFLDVCFEAEADFDEGRFDGDADFSGSGFEAPAVFREAAFEGESRHIDPSAVFTDVSFAAAADFDNATFRSADFTRARFGDVVEVAGSEFDELAFPAESAGDDTYVDLTEAVLEEGSITQAA